MNKKGIDARLKNIQGLFSGANSQDSILGSEGIYIIPEYQRAYNWKSNEQCDKLWQDIEDFINERKNDTYFFGSIIINSDSDNLYIIDRQQSITTFMLLLKALLLQITVPAYSLPCLSTAPGGALFSFSYCSNYSPVIVPSNSFSALSSSGMCAYCLTYSPPSLSYMTT